MTSMSRFPSLFDSPLERSSSKQLTSLSTLPETRPQTSSGLHSGPRRRRRTDTIDSIRNSIFGGRKKPDVEPFSRPLSRQASQAGLRPTTPIITTNSEHEFYRHRKKSSISPPFNFQHISHAAKNSLPALDTVDEGELQQQFFDASQVTAAPGELQSIKADKLEERLRLENGDYDTTHPHYRPGPDELEPRNVDETTFDEAEDTRFDPEACVPPLTPPYDITRLPRRHVSMFSLTQAEEWLSSRSQSRMETEVQSPTAPGFDVENITTTSNDNGTYDSGTSSDTIMQDDFAPRPATVSVVLDSMPSELEHLDRLQPAGWSPAADHQSNKSRKSAAASHLSVASFTSSVKSFPSSSSRYTAKSMAFSSIGESAGDNRLSDDLSWEDEIDFMYEQEAEATCDFDWRVCDRTFNSTSSPHHYFAEHAASQSTLSSSSLRYSSTPNLLTGQKSRNHTRGSSVGHRGFLMARNASAENLGKLSPPKLSPRFYQSDLHACDLSPVPSESTDTFDTAPEDHDKIRPASMSSPSPSASNATGSSKLPRSWHRKSKSQGSSASWNRHSASPAKKNKRWSIGSVTSIPDLLYSSRKAWDTLHKRGESRAMKTLPSLPTSAGPSPQLEQKDLPPLPPCQPIDEAESEVEADDPSPTLPPKDGIIPDDDDTSSSEEADQVPVMRRPQSPGERAALQAAGSAVRRSRPNRSCTPSRYSHAPETPRSPPIPTGWI